MGLRCPVCGRHAAERLSHKIGSWAGRRRLTRFWTFTLDPKRIPGVSWTPGHTFSPAEIRCAVAYLRDVWNKYLTRWRRDAPDLSFIAVLELQESGNPHLHVLVNGWFPVRLMRSRWIRYGGGHNVQVNGITGGAEGVARYVSKYLAKSTPIDPEDAPPDDLPPEGDTGPDTTPYNEWPAYTRHHTTSRDVHLGFTAEQWDSIDAGDWRLCFPMITRNRNGIISRAAAAEICRGCVFRRAGCSGVADRAILWGPFGPINRPKFPTLRAVFDASPEYLAVLSAQEERKRGAGFARLVGYIAGRFRPLWTAADDWGF